MTVPDPLALVLVAATSSKKSNPTFLIVLVVIVFLGYFLFLRPQQQKQKRARQQSSSVEVGDEILTVGGIVGRVVDVTDDRITMVTGAESQGIAAVGSEPTRLVMVKQAVARKIEPAVHEVDEHGDVVDDEHDGHDGGLSFEHDEFSHDGDADDPDPEDHVEEHTSEGPGSEEGTGK